MVAGEILKLKGAFCCPVTLCSRCNSGGNGGVLGYSLRQYLRQGSYLVFAIYRLALALVVLIAV